MLVSTEDREELHIINALKSFGPDYPKWIFEKMKHS